MKHTLSAMDYCECAQKLLFYHCKMTAGGFGVTHCKVGIHVHWVSKSIKSPLSFIYKEFNYIDELPVKFI